MDIARTVIILGGIGMLVCSFLYLLVSFIRYFIRLFRVKRGAILFFVHDQEYGTLHMFIVTLIFCFFLLLVLGVCFSYFLHYF